MKREFHAAHPFALKDSVTQAFALEWLVDKSDRLPHSWREIAAIQDPVERIDILSQAILTAYKEQARVGTRREEGGYRYWLKHVASVFLQARHSQMERLGLIHSLPNPNLFPPGSWAIQFTFTLRKPYISKDDVDFYILDNPVKKEWVFKVPYVAPSQWKGALRSAMVRELVGQLQADTLDESAFTEQRLQLYRLFGNEKDGTAVFLNRALARHRMGPLPEDADDTTQRRWQQRFEETIRTVAGEFEQALREKTYRIGEIEGFQGCLHFYPTYFDRIGLEVINPHPRDTGAGKQPIYFECVPEGSEGTFTLLYVPLGGPETSPDEARRQAAEDLQAVVAGVETMMIRYGFGAKTSSGYGVVAEEFVKDEQGRSQAIIRVENGKGFRCRSFTGLRQAATKLVKELGHDA